ncbi:ABC transporter permease [Streptomyces sp. SID3343]|uniref:ABC transporter permease n=1 Tax=Streptomyces sp. SID3343 TaxID=2690260 RepID=UPI00136E0726|nr:ABC transporter permease [Streptomyces sp. SID3343]MYW06056.1 ABC transporter permease subunit [Streptomyces sp. SID3343]
MRGYLIRRLVQAVVVLWAAFTVSFVVLYLLPGDSLSIKLGGLESTATPEQLAAVRAANGLDDPLYTQYAHALGNALTGDLGESAQTGAPVARTIADALPETVKLTVFAMVLAVVGGVSLALAATFTRLRALRQVLLSLPAVGISMPGFWVGLLLVQVVSFQWGLLPAIGNEGFDSLVLPAITMALPAGAMIAQVLAKSMTTALAQPYIDTARAKGVGRVRIHVRHALRNASLPALTLAGVVAGNVLVESVVVETVFSRVGIGRLTAAAVDNQDLAMVQGVVLLAAVTFVVVGLVVDVLYPVLDPRVGRAV